MRWGLVSLGIAARFAPLFYIAEQFEGLLIVVGAEGHALATVGVEAAPGTFQDPGSKEVLREFRHIIAVAFLPAVGKPVFSIEFHVGNITVACPFRQSLLFSH